LFLKRVTEQERKTNAVITVDGKKWTVQSEIRNSNISPLIHIVSTCPNGKTEILSKFDKLGDREYKGNFTFKQKFVKLFIYFFK